MYFLEEIYDKRLGLKTEDEVFLYLYTNIKETIASWDYYVNWNKVVNNVNKIEMKLNLLNYLIGKDNIEDEMRNLLKTYPEVISVIPIVIASRNKQFMILDPIKNNIFNYQVFEFKNKKSLTENDIEKAMEFIKNIGFLELLKNKTIKNVVDYTLGVEVGLDTNARKNRTGDAMEKILELFVKKLCDEKKYEYMIQATVKDILEKWDKVVETDEADRHFDAVINNGTKLFLIETNYYSSQGSKLKSVAGEFSTLNKLVTNNDVTFCWVTDGAGWKTAKAALRETYNEINYIFNLSMLENGALDYIVNNNL